MAPFKPISKTKRRRGSNSGDTIKQEYENHGHERSLGKKSAVIPSIASNLKVKSRKAILKRTSSASMPVWNDATAETLNWPLYKPDFAQQRYPSLLKKRLLDPVPDTLAEIEAVMSGLSKDGKAPGTWGSLNTQPINATRVKRTMPRFSESIIDLVDHEQADVEIIETRGENDPNRSGLLKLPMEVRERIYAILFRNSQPIQVQEDLQSVPFSPNSDISIMLVCKQISLEARDFFWSKGIFLIRFDETVGFRRWPAQRKIPKALMPCFKNVIFKLAKDDHYLQWNYRPVSCLEILSTANVYLEVLTIVLSLDLTDGRMGNRPKPYSIFGTESTFMQAVCNLRCKKLRVVISRGQLGHAEIHIDMLPLEMARASTATYPEFMAQRLQLGQATKAQLHDLPAAIKYLEQMGIENSKD